MELTNKKLALFFTEGISLEIWEKVGNLDREIKPYKELAKCFNEIYFFTYGKRDDLKYQAILPQNIRIFPNKWNLSSKIYSFLLPFFYRKELQKVDILKTNQMGGSWTAWLAKFLFRKKLIIRCGHQWRWDLEKSKVKRWKILLVSLIEGFIYRKADAIIVTSTIAKKDIEQYYKILSSKIEIIPNYIDTDLFKRKKKKKEEKRICFVARLVHRKNLLNLLKSVDGLNVKLVIFGNGELREKLKKKTKEIKSAKIEFRGNIPNNLLPEELNKSELFILPSFYEGNPKTLLEAMSCGLPCVGTNVEGIKEIIKHKENGYLCDTDANSIRKAILKVLEDKHIRTTLGQNARRTILENFGLEKILEKEINIYENL